MALLCLLSTIALGCGVFKAISFYTPFLGFYLCFCFLNLHFPPCFGCFFLYFFAPVRFFALCVFSFGTACAMFNFPTYVSSSLEIIFLISSSVEYLLCCFLQALWSMFVSLLVILLIVCQTGGLLDFVFCVSAYLWLLPSMCSALVHFTFLCVLRTTYVLWYTQPVLRGYLLFVDKTSQI